MTASRVKAARELNEYAEHTRDVMIPELERLAVPWRFLAWRKLFKEIERRNDYVREELARLS